MNKGLNSNRTGYNTSSSLYGGDISVADSDLDNYWKQGSSKKKKKQQQQQQQQKQKGKKHKLQDEEEEQQTKKVKKSHTPAGMVNLGYGLIDESSSLVFSSTKVEGVCTKLEKDYLRLTSAADPANVRAPATLKQALTMVKRKWIDTQDYEYTCNQLKSIRQDCTVQHMRNEFTVEVYETHARIALESGDFQEFAQCQTQLQLLYKDGHSNGFERECEFAAYKILYACLMIGPSDSGLVSFINSLDDARRSQDAIEHAMSVRTALLTTNFYRFFNALSAAPNMSAYIMDPLADSMRQRTARIIVSAYRPKISLEHMARALAFDREEEEENGTIAATASPTEQKPITASVLRACKEYLDDKFEGKFVYIKEPPPDGVGSVRYFIDCKVTGENLAPSNAAHRLPINSARAKHTVSASSSTLAAASSSPAHAPIAAPHDVSMWIKKDSADATGRIKLGRVDNGSGSLSNFSLASSGSQGQPVRKGLVSLSPAFSPSMSPTPSPPPIVEDAVARKRRNSQPLSLMSYEDLKAAIDDIEVILLDQSKREQYDEFNLQLMMTRLKALQKQLKKTKKSK